eukprot:TRINITY_DN27982_c0_g1_i1.p1 TRINITY_DN27982_c0_g1~~TRINITY_DN27982_c0_g1_i1.p1  ORF type:complete len:305 (-),score=72.37 TRINITY_DN27982_c0_g1_i1:158-1072(-)
MGRRRQNSDEDTEAEDRLDKDATKTQQGNKKGAHKKREFKPRERNRCDSNEFIRDMSKSASPDETVLAESGPLLEALPSALMLLEAKDLCECRAASSSWRCAAESRVVVEIAWRAAVEASFPAMAENLLKKCSANEEVDWLGLFLARCERKRAWAIEREAEKARKAERAARLKADAEGESVQKVAVGPEGNNKRTRNVREKTCKRCGTRFVPAATGIMESTCRYHTGKYQQVDEDGVALPDSTGGASLQRQIKEQLRKNGSKSGSKKKGGSLEILTLGQEMHFRWSCCGELSLGGRGCTTGDHC